MRVDIIVMSWIWGEIFQYFIIVIFEVDFFLYILLGRLRKLPSILGLLHFILIRYWGLSHVSSLSLKVFKNQTFIEWFLNVISSLYYWNKPKLAMMYYFYIAEFDLLFFCLKYLQFWSWEPWLIISLLVILFSPTLDKK